jgi:hypothetical protein
VKRKEHQFEARGDRGCASAQEVEGKKGQPAEGSEPWSVQSCPLLSFPTYWRRSFLPHVVESSRPYPENNHPPRTHMEDILQIVRFWSILHSQRIAGTIHWNPQLSKCVSMLLLFSVSNLHPYPSWHASLGTDLDSPLVRFYLFRLLCSIPFFPNTFDSVVNSNSMRLDTMHYITHFGVCVNHRISLLTLHIPLFTFETIFYLPSR